MSKQNTEPLNTKRNSQYGIGNRIDYELLLKDENLQGTRELLLSNFEYFVMFFHRAIFNEDFLFKPFHTEIIRRLEGYVFGDIFDKDTKQVKKNTCICIPPRSGKSLLMVYWIPFCFAHNSRCNFIYTCYEETITNKMSSDMMNLIKCMEYQRIFGVQMSQDTTAKGLWETKDKGTYRAGALGSAITGFGAGRMGQNFGGAFVIDDPLNAVHYNSTIKKEEVRDRYKNVIETRLNNADRTPIILIMQRLATDDLVGYIKENEPDKWEFIEIPALSEDENGNLVSYFPERMSVDALLSKKDDRMDVFLAQYQQDPMVLGGERCKEEWFSFYPTNAEYNYTRCFMTADTAFKKTEYADYTAVILFGVTKDNRLHIIDLLHEKINAVDLKVRLMAFWNKWRNGVDGRKVSSFRVEDKASGMQLLQDMKKIGGLPVIGIKNRGDAKDYLWGDVFPMIQSANILLPNSPNDAISKKIIGELTQLRFDMKHKHDDIMDAISFGYDYSLRKKGLF